MIRFNSDHPMAGFAAEAATFGKPAVVGGYRLHEWKNYVPEEMLPPSQICHPDDLEAAIEQLIIDPQYRKRLGDRARDLFKLVVAGKVAARYYQVIQGDIPDAWWLDPREVIYLHGTGITEERIKLNIRKLVETYGTKSLQLSHRPDLEAAFLKFAGL